MVWPILISVSLAPASYLPAAETRLTDAPSAVVTAAVLRNVRRSRTRLLIGGLPLDVCLLFVVFCFAAPKAAMRPSRAARALAFVVARMSGATSGVDRRGVPDIAPLIRATGSCSRMQDQFLHPPVQQLGGVDHVLRRTRQCMDPAELLELFAGLAEHPQHLAVERELVDPPRPGVRTVDHLLRSGGDADRPGRSRREGAAGHHGLVGNLADRGPGVRWHRNVDDHLPQEFSVAIEHLDAVVAAIGDVDVPLRVSGDAMRRIELAGTGAAVAPRFQPVAVFVHLCDPRVDVAVADEGVAGGIPCHVGDLPEAAVLGGQGRLGMFQRRRVFVGGLLLAAEYHQHAAFRVELDHHVRALVSDPDVVGRIDLHRVAERPGVQVLADLADELAVGAEFQQLRCRRRIGGAAGVAARQHEHVSLGIDGDAGGLAEIHVGRQLQRIDDGVESDCGHGGLRPGEGCLQRQAGRECGD